MSWRCIAALLSAPALAGADGAEVRVREIVPEFNAFVKISDRTRLFVLGDVARSSPDDVSTGELGVHLDYTLQPWLRPQLRDADWERSRYVWMRAGYQRLGNLSGDPDAKAENRWLLEATARLELPGEIWLVNRLRVDLRDVGGSHSRRYRYRIGAENEFATPSGVVLVPYAQAEWFYDTRFDAWSRRLLQGGVEVELSKVWRLEPYYAYEKNTNPGGVDVSRFGLVLKCYR